MIFCTKHGIIRHRTCLYTPQQNGIAERFNRTILDKVRCMLIQSGLPGKFWAEAASTACYLINRSPTSAIGNKIPNELWNMHSVSYSHLKVFGCIAFAHTKQSKLEPRALKCIFIGYPEGIKGHKLWCPDKKKVIVSRDVVFIENEIYNSNLQENEKVDISLFEVELSEYNR